MGTYQLHIQSSKDCDFTTSYSSVFNVVVYGNMEEITCNTDDLTSPDLLSLLDQLPSHFLGRYEIRKRSRDLLVLYRVANDTEEYTMYEFQVIARGCSLVYSGQFNFQEGSIEDRKNAIMQWLDAIDVLTEEERLSFAEYSGKSKMKIPVQYNKQNAPIDNGIRIGIPRGFQHFSRGEDKYKLPRLVIVPNDYPITDDPMKAPIALMVLSDVIDNVSTKEEFLDHYYAVLCNSSGVFHQSGTVRMDKFSDKGYAITQVGLLQDHTAVVSMTALFAKNRIYFIRIVINYPSYDFDQTQARWDIEHFSKAWIGRIQVTGETIPHYPSRNEAVQPKPASSASQKLPAQNGCSYQAVFEYKSWMGAQQTTVTGRDAQDLYNKLDEFADGLSLCLALQRGLEDPKSKAEEEKLETFIQKGQAGTLSIEEIRDFQVTFDAVSIKCLSLSSHSGGHLELVKADPDSSLYPHYDQLGDTSKPKTAYGGAGIIITNAGGTEFESYPFSRFDGELKAVAERAINKDSCGKEYRQLVSTATAYAALFRVNKDKFNPKEDRECDIRNLRMRRAYQLHVLRSFAWTLAEQASSQQKSLPDLVADDYQKIFTTIEKRDYLNYRADSHFPVLCGTADLHVFFVPDKTTKDDKKVLNESGEVFGNTIPNSIGSLEGLRKDLLALSEPMGKLFQHLLSNRDYSQPLTGTAADVLYAWCTMVLSAETPFYMEDGPMTCFYTQITEPRIPTLVETKTQSKKKPNGKIYTINGNTLHSYNGKAFTPEIPDDIQIIGTGAFNENSELGCTEIPKSVTTIKTGAFRNCPNLFRIIIPNIPIRIEKDAFINCPKLYIDTVPNSAAEKYCKENGIPCKTDALCAKDAAKTAKKQIKVTKESVANTSIKTASNADETRSKKLPGRKFYEVDADLRLIRYKGNAYDKLSLTIPKDVSIISRGAIVDDEQVRFVIIPKSVTLIETGAFQNLPKLLSVVVPDTDIKIEKGAFINCPNYRFDAFSGSPIEKYCKRNGIPCVTDNLCKAHFPEIARRKEKEKAKAEAESRAKAEAEQKRIEEENRLKRIAASLQQKLAVMYQDSLDTSKFEAIKRTIETAITDICDRQTWSEIRKRKIPAIPMANLSETHKKLESVAPEEAYDLLPEWIAEEYIHTSEEKRIQHLRAEEEKKARLAFETIIRELNGIANESVLPLYESGIEKNEILEQFASRAKTVVGDGAIINSGLAKYIGNATLGILKSSLGRKPFDSAESLVDAVIEKKSSEIDRLTSLLEKKNSDLETIEKEKATLEEERSHLGLFQGKRKKEIAALLEKIPERIKQVEDEYKAEKSKI